ncbi:MAG: 2,4-dienoyl-CoA reductase [Planctomycetes bacterium]|nr:2,4-dienoyl-CoA reductase [Planctomycetota bacterium]
MLPDATFANRTVLVTGGGTGLGKETAHRFGELGARVVIASRKAEHLDPAAEELRGAGVDVLAVPTDVTRPARVAALLETAVERFGRIDVLVNNAAGNFYCPTADLSPAGWKVVIDIALNGVFYCSREIGRHMIEQGGGRIVNVVATYAWTGGPGTAHSAAAKAGVLALTRTLAVEWAQHDVRVNAVSPGPFHSDGAKKRLWPDAKTEAAMKAQVPLQRFATRHEVADAITWLASPFADYVNGEVLVMDGGAHLGRGLTGEA